jgi:GxxExxY protein
MPNEPNAEVNRLSHDVIGAAIEVHRILGPGYLEALYEEALAAEFELRGVPFVRQSSITVSYKNKLIGEGRLDFLVDDCLIVELKAVETLMPIHSAQVLSYLKITRLSLGLLINFNVEVLRQGIKRIVLSSKS